MWRKGKIEINMAKYIVDFTGSKSLQDIHIRFKQVFDFPDYYGENWSAFWDCITDMIGDPMYIEVYGLADLQKLSEKHANIFKKCMENLLHYAGGKYSHITHVKYID